MGKRTLFQKGNADSQWVHEKMLNIANDQGTANQKHNEIFTSYLSEVLSSKTTSGTNVGKGVEKREAPIHCWWKCKLIQTLWRMI